ncbi:hypothetical protein PPERSA_01424 [Pseudocohnilembus persalinus]|uniref:Uncharacterized protein n=1 Tax=Pseudocohnilembus persalinus TaxID=266149 RepID=A0A0V0QGV8_PSEPJ|nr:hypothetical protein PPERSA_01424 [Pseudocohnilembus persalinus]|eukprot:KRX01521.1 hypothetical protein PPERSA_01424 [Pseudocohnilembus persalinus]
MSKDFNGNSFQGVLQNSFFDGKIEINYRCEFCKNGILQNKITGDQIGDKDNMQEKQEKDIKTQNLDLNLFLIDSKVYSQPYFNLKVNQNSSDIQQEIQKIFRESNIVGKQFCINCQKEQYFEYRKKLTQAPNILQINLDIDLDEKLYQNQEFKIQDLKKRVNQLNYQKKNLEQMEQINNQSQKIYIDSQNYKFELLEQNEIKNKFIQNEANNRQEINYYLYQNYAGKNKKSSQQKYMGNSQIGINLSNTSQQSHKLNFENQNGEINYVEIGLQQQQKQQYQQQNQGFEEMNQILQSSIFSYKSQKKNTSFQNDQSQPYDFLNSKNLSQKKNNEKEKNKQEILEQMIQNLEDQIQNIGQKIYHPLQESFEMIQKECFLEIDSPIFVIDLVYEKIQTLKNHLVLKDLEIKDLLGKKQIDYGFQNLREVQEKNRQIIEIFGGLKQVNEIKRDLEFMKERYQIKKMEELFQLILIEQKEKHEQKIQKNNIIDKDFYKQEDDKEIKEQKQIQQQQELKTIQENTVNFDKDSILKNRFLIQKIQGQVEKENQQ